MTQQEKYSALQSGWMCAGVGTCVIANFSEARRMVLFSLKLSHSQY